MPQPPSSHPPALPGGDTAPPASRIPLSGWRSWVLPAPGLELEAKLFQLLALLAAVMTLLVIVPFNFFQNLSPWLNATAFVFGAVATWLWQESRRGRTRPVTMFMACMVLLNVTWFVNGGSQGSIVLYFFDAVLLPIIFCRGRMRVQLLTLFFIDVAVLYWVDYRFPRWIVPFETPFDRFIDNVTGFATGAAVLVVAVDIVLRSYLTERARLIESNQRLQKSLEENRTLRGLLPLCAWCRKIRTDEGFWTQLESYVAANTDASFTHGMCPDCYARETERAEAHVREGRVGTPEGPSHPGISFLQGPGL